MDSAALRKNLCSNFCSFYKAGKEEEPGCRGFTAVALLLGQKKQIDFSPRPGYPSGVSRSHLDRYFCPPCPFYADGCDYAAGADGGVPCGGFIFIGHLLDEGVIAVDDIRNMV